METDSKLAVVYFPQINSNQIADFREMYDPGWEIIPPHITIVSPVSDMSEERLIEHVASISKDIESFSIHLTGLTRTSDDNLFLLVKEGNEDIRHLHDTLYSGLLTQYIPTDFPFIPHITLGYFRTKVNTFDNTLFDKAYAEAQSARFDITCAFNALAIIKGNGVNAARIIKTISLLRND